jgi:hypothetical protein
MCTDLLTRVVIPSDFEFLEMVRAVPEESRGGPGQLIQTPTGPVWFRFFFRVGQRRQPRVARSIYFIFFHTNRPPNLTAEIP